MNSKNSSNKGIFVSGIWFVVLALVVFSSGSLVAQQEPQDSSSNQNETSEESGTSPSAEENDQGSENQSSAEGSTDSTGDSEPAAPTGDEPSAGQDSGENTGAADQGTFSFLNYNREQWATKIFGDEKMPYPGYRSPHRLRLLFSVGAQDISPAVLNEAGPSWFTNSLIKKAQEPTTPLAFPIAKPDNVGVNPYGLDAEYSYRDRLFFTATRDRVDAVFSRNSPTMVTFLNPGTDVYTASLYEGVRLLSYTEERVFFDVAYVYPVYFDWLKVGLSLGNEDYTEKNDFSFGSYLLRRSTAATEPLVRIWGAGGVINSRYDMYGILPGILVRARPLRWLEIVYRLQLVNRSGSMHMRGTQVLEKTNTVDSTTSYLASFPVYMGQARDKGTLTTLDLGFRYCRFSAHLGFEWEGLKRSYSSYLGKVLSPVNDVTVKADGIGLAELNGEFEHSRSNIYLALGVDFRY